MTDKPGITLELGEKPDTPLPTGLSETAVAVDVALDLPLSESQSTNLQFEDDEMPLTPVTAQPAPVRQPEPAPTSLDGDEGSVNNNMEDDPEEDVVPKIVRKLKEHIFNQDKRPLKDALALALPTLAIDDTADLMQIAAAMANSLTQEQRDALTIYGLGSALLHQDDVYEKFFENPNANLVQVLRTKGGDPLQQTIPPFKEPKVGQILDIAEASAYAARLSEAMDYLYIIAHHSGMWLKINVPQGTDLHNILATQTLNRNQLGYATRGATLSSDTALRNMTFLNWLLDRVMATNMKDSSRESIRKNLVAMDIQMLAQQTASAIHPSGFPTERACSSKPGVCTHIESAILRISKMQFIDESRFTDKQREHMSTLLRKSHAKTDEDMATYRREFGTLVSSAIDCGNGIIFNLAPPTVDIYEDTAEEWASGTKRESEEILSLMTEQEARKHTEDQAAMATLTRYGAWVESINMQGRFVQDRMSIRAVLVRFSEKEEIVEKFVEGVKKFITECTVAAVGVNDYVCPVCNGKQAHMDSGLLSSVAPLDAITAFFTLAQLKTRLLRSNASVG